MRIGLDFDGVVSDAGTLKSYGLKKLFGIELPPEKIKREFIVGKILTLEQYEFLREQIYGTKEIGLLTEEVPGMQEYTRRLMSKRHDLIIISSRGNKKTDPGKTDIALEWMKLHKLSIPFIGIGEGVSKADACRGLDVYIDDDLDKLEPLVGIVQHRYLFSWGYNKHVEVPKEIAQRINSWQHFYEEISKLNSR